MLREVITPGGEFHSLCLPFGMSEQCDMTLPLGTLAHLPAAMLTPDAGRSRTLLLEDATPGPATDRPKCAAAVEQPGCVVAHAGMSRHFDLAVPDPHMPV
jgi:hypothetical protein